MAECEVCGDEILVEFECSHCGKRLCVDHQIPENHDCSLLATSLWGWARGDREDNKRRREQSTPDPDRLPDREYDPGESARSPEVALDGSIVEGTQADIPERSTWGQGLNRVAKYVVAAGLVATVGLALWILL
jgi:hypothetical protein